MEVTRNGIETRPGPAEWFTGAVYIDVIATPSGPSRLSASSVHFHRVRERPGTPTPTDRPSMCSRASAAPNAAAAPSRSSAPVTVLSSNPVKSTGTAPRPIAS